jgi:hypothetical protein
MKNMKGMKIMKKSLIFFFMSFIFFMSFMCDFRILDVGLGSLKQK